MNDEYFDYLVEDANAAVDKYFKRLYIEEAIIEKKLGSMENFYNEKVGLGQVYKVTGKSISGMFKNIKEANIYKEQYQTYKQKYQKDKTILVPIILNLISILDGYIYTAEYENITFKWYYVLDFGKLLRYNMRVRVETNKKEAIGVASFSLNCFVSASL